MNTYYLKKFKILYIKNSLKKFKNNNIIKIKHNWVQNCILGMSKKYINIKTKKFILKKIKTFKNIKQENYCQKSELN